MAIVLGAYSMPFKRIKRKMSTSEASTTATNWGTNLRTDKKKRASFLPYSAPPPSPSYSNHSEVSSTPGSTATFATSAAYAEAQVFPPSHDPEALTLQQQSANIYAYHNHHLALYERLEGGFYHYAQRQLQQQAPACWHQPAVTRFNDVVEIRGGSFQRPC